MDEQTLLQQQALAAQQQMLYAQQTGVDQFAAPPGTVDDCRLILD